MPQNKGRPVEILLIEDNYGDVLLTQVALNDAKIANNITVASDGEQALEMLRQEGKYVDYKLPDLVLLDLNLPKKEGKEVLAEIKSDERLKRIPVVILTSSNAERDVVRSYNLHANSYIIKPVNLEKFAEIVSSIESFWFTIVSFPEENTQKLAS